MMAASSLSLPLRTRTTCIASAYLLRPPSTARRRYSSSSSNGNGNNNFIRSDFSSQPFTGVYEPGQPTSGPLGGASVAGAPRLTPRMLKDHLDEFVVGQERAKKILSVAVYNHYQRVQEVERLADEREEEEQRALRGEGGRREVLSVNRHPVEGHQPVHRTENREPWLMGQEDEFPGQQPTVNVFPQGPPQPQQWSFGTQPLHAALTQESTPLTIEKSNVLLLGPTGTGKTLLAKTLARVLDVPFSMSDCTPLTQAGYIGEDAEVCIQRLLSAANYDVAAAEKGIVVLDEIDKIASAKVHTGKDVGGEGVQQALLKIIEGTTVQVTARNEKGATSGNTPKGPGNISGTSQFPSPLGGGPQPPPGKNEVYNVRTDNILFIFTGAFVGLHKLILDRISKGSIGFGAAVRSAPKASGAGGQETMLGEEDRQLFEANLPFYDASPAPQNLAEPTAQMQKTQYNALDLLTPADLRTYGMIPELIGRIPISCALSALSVQALMRVLTEPRNALTKQYVHLFALSGVELVFTKGSLFAISGHAYEMGTGARGLRMVMERVLGESMFECPGSTVKHILITEAAVGFPASADGANKGELKRSREKPVYMTRGQKHRFDALVQQHEDDWQRRSVPKEETYGSFEEYRKDISMAAGS